jgi:electron transfer flavoprotein alpha subunit
MVLPAAPAPSEVVAMVREKGGQEEEELAWLEALAGCLGAAVALARRQDDLGSQVRRGSS